MEHVGTGEYVVPKPNRLVVVKAGTSHRINTVHAASGENVRISVAGFFVRPTPQRGDLVEADAPTAEMLGLLAGY